VPLPGAGFRDGCLTADGRCSLRLWVRVGPRARRTKSRIPTRCCAVGTARSASGSGSCTSAGGNSNDRLTRGSTLEEAAEAQAYAKQAHAHAEQAHELAAWRHAEAAALHEHLAEVLDELGRPDQALAHRDAAEYELAAADDEERAAQEEGRREQAAGGR
jgi:hypothetical protein